MNITLGLLLSLIAGLMLGSFALPQKKIKQWQWENYWAVFTLFGAFIFPLVIALITVPHLTEVIWSAPANVLWAVFGFGSAWGIANIGYGMSIQKLGIAMALALVLGINNAVGSILPILLYYPDKLTQPVGLWIISGVAIIICGIVLCAIAGNVREKEQNKSNSGKSDKGLFLFWLVIAIGTGILAAAFNFALIFGKPLEIIAISKGAIVTNAANATWVVGLTGGCIVTLLYCAFLWFKNKTFVLFVKSGTSINWLLAGLMGLLWFGGVMIYGMSASMLGVLGASIGWPIIQGMSVGSANFWGIVTGEFMGAAKAKKIMYLSLLFIILGVICIGYAGSL